MIKIIKSRSSQEGTARRERRSEHRAARTSRVIKEVVNLNSNTAVITLNVNVPNAPDEILRLYKVTLWPRERE